MSWVGVGIILANLGLKQVYKENKSVELDHSDCHMSQSRVSPKKWVEHNPGTVCCSVAASYRWRTRADAAPTQSARHVPQLVGTDAGGRPTASERVATPDDIQHLAVEVEVAGWQSQDQVGRVAQVGRLQNSWNITVRTNDRWPGVVLSVSAPCPTSSWRPSGAPLDWCQSALCQTRRPSGSLPSAHRSAGSRSASSAAGRSAARFSCGSRRLAVGWQACLARHPAHTVFSFQCDHLDGHGRRRCTSVRQLAHGSAIAVLASRRSRSCVVQPSDRPAARGACSCRSPVSSWTACRSGKVDRSLTSAVHQLLQHVQHNTHHAPMLAGRQEQHDFQQSLCPADLWHAVLLRPAGQHFQQ